MAQPTDITRFEEANEVVYSGATLAEIETASPSSTHTSLAGTTSGTVIADLVSVPGKLGKVFVLQFVNYAGNAANITLPVALTAGAAVVGTLTGITLPATAAAGTTVVLPATTAAVTGSAIVFGE